MASKFIPGGNTPLAKSKGNNSTPMNGRGKFTRVVLRQKIEFLDESKNKIVSRMIFHKLRGRTDAQLFDRALNGIK